MLQLKAKCTPYENCLQDWIWKTIQNRNHQQQQQQQWRWQQQQWWRQPQQLRQQHQLERQSLKRQSITATSIKRQSILRISSQRKKFYKREYKIWQRGSEHRKSLVFKFPRLFGFWMHPGFIEMGLWMLCLIHRQSSVELWCFIVWYFSTAIGWTHTILTVRHCGRHPLMEWGGGGGSHPLSKEQSVLISLSMFTIYLLQHMVVRWQYYQYICEQIIICAINFLTYVYKCINYWQ